MPNLKELKNHMDSIRDTQKITNAMYLISSTKMRKAKKELDATRPYFDALQGEIKRIFRTVKGFQNRFFYPEDGSEAPDGCYACLVITSDKGLAGAYNHNVIKETMRLLKRHQNTKLYVVGDYGRHYFEKHGIPVVQEFVHHAHEPELHEAREIAVTLLEAFMKNEVDKIFVVYTDWKNSMTEKVLTRRLIPFHRSAFLGEGGSKKVGKISGSGKAVSFELKNEKTVKAPFEFLPSVEAIIDAVMPSYFTGFVYSALVDSFCSEQTARMTAMSSADRNADKILASLEVEYKRVRQTGITQEITEVSSGAKAQKRKEN